MPKFYCFFLETKGHLFLQLGSKNVNYVQLFFTDKTIFLIDQVFFSFMMRE